MGDVPVNPEEIVPDRSLANRLRLPRLSGKASAAWLVVCFALTAVLIPMALRLPVWIAFEIVVAAWWAIWLVVLSGLLYRGQRISDDHQLGEPRNWFAGDSNRPARSDSDRSWWDGFFWGSFWGDGEGLLIILGLIVLVGLIWFLFEVAIPVLLFLLYFITRGMLAHVVNDRHHCRGRLGRALAWGFLWATAYTVPLAAGVWLVHYVHRNA
jgi:hypothetical protein